MCGNLGDYVLKGEDDSDPNYFDCGDSFDAIIDFNPAKGDITAGNCEIFYQKDIFVMPCRYSLFYYNTYCEEVVCMCFYMIERSITNTNIFEYCDRLSSKQVKLKAKAM
jgi:hypothetical protein